MEAMEHGAHVSMWDEPEGRNTDVPKYVLGRTGQPAGIPLANGAAVPPET